MSLGGRGGPRGIGSSSNWPVTRASWWRSTSPSHGASWWFATSPRDGHEVRTTHVGRSSELWRRLPAPTRSLRSLVCSRIKTKTSSRIGRLAGRCPSGEEAQRDVALAVRQYRARHVSDCSRSCRLPAALAGDDEWEGDWLSSLAARSRRGSSACRFLGRVQYARGGVVG
jgi:hypothetical protein